jgi:hypothetical protein
MYALGRNRPLGRNGMNGWKADVELNKAAGRTPSRRPVVLLPGSAERAFGKAV